MKKLLLMFIFLVSCNDTPKKEINLLKINSCYLSQSGNVYKVKKILKYGAQAVYLNGEFQKALVYITPLEAFDREVDCGGFEINI